MTHVVRHDARQTSSSTCKTYNIIHDTIHVTYDIKQYKKLKHIFKSSLHLSEKYFQAEQNKTLNKTTCNKSEAFLVISKQIDLKAMIKTFVFQNMLFDKRINNIDEPNNSETILQTS